MTPHSHLRILVALVLILLIGDLPLSHAQTMDELKAGVVKIRATVGGQHQMGTGFIVNLTETAAYIVTVAHVVEGDPNPKVAFFPEATKFLPARVVGVEGGNPNGLAALVVEGKLPEGLRPLITDTDGQVRGGEESKTIGFPGEAGTPWLVTAGTIGGRKGSQVTFSGVIYEGSSGGPLLVNDKVVGVVNEMGSQLGYAIPMVTAKFTLEGWGVELTESVEGLLAKEITGKDGAPMVLVPAGRFTMGSNDGSADEKPQREVELDAFYIDKYEVTTSRYAKFFQTIGWETPRYWSDTVLVSQGDRPVVGVTWDDAKAYCEKYGKRLPTEAEWEKAARGTDGRTYPWGNSDPDSSRANFDRYTISWKTDLYSKRLKPVGNYEAGESPYGAYDMAGNVGEWVADWYDKNYYKNSPRKNPRGPSSGKERVIRGGSWYNDSWILRAAHRSVNRPSDRVGEIGFRCAQDAR